MNIQNSYNSGHPWYYVLNGKVLSIKEIWNEANSANKYGYNQESIEKASGNNEKLRILKAEHIKRLKTDISRYRQCALELHKFRKKTKENDTLQCEDVHVSISLKHNHIYSEFLNLKHIDRLLSYQPELF